MRNGWELRRSWPCWRRTRSAGPLQRDCQIRKPTPSSQRPKLHLRGPCYFNADVRGLQTPPELADSKCLQSWPPTCPNVQYSTN